MRLLNFAIILAAWFLSAGCSWAALTQQTIAQAGFNLRPGVMLPKDAVLDGPTGSKPLREWLADKPALVTFVDYRCRSFCGIILDELAQTLTNVPLRLGQDYNVLAVALDDRQVQADASTFRDLHTAGTPVKSAGLFLTEGAGALKALEKSVGLTAPFDQEHKQFAHPIGLIVVDAGGHAQQILSPFSIDPVDLRLALTAGSRAPSLASRVRLLCYGWDPARGLYTLRIQRILSVMAAISVALLAGMIAWFIRQNRKLSEAHADQT